MMLDLPFGDFVASRMLIPIQVRTSSSFSPIRTSMLLDGFYDNESWDVFDAVWMASQVSHTKGVR